MKNSEIRKYAVYSMIGFVIFSIGLVMVKTLPNMQGILRTLPYICIGIGTGIFGQNIGTVISSLALRNALNQQRRLKSRLKTNVIPQLEIVQKQNLTI